MTRKRRSFTAEFKARVALEAIKNQHTLQEIASRFEVHPNQVVHWKRQALESLPGVFSKGRVLDQKADEELRDQLYQQIGRLQVELEWLKKSRDFRVEDTTELDRADS
jgi:transposase-like protein